MGFLLDGWGRRARISIDHTKVDANLTNFPLLLRKANLPEEMFHSNGLHPAINGGGDLRASSDEAGDVQLSLGVRTFVTDPDPNNGDAELWVKIPTVSSATDTYFYIWWGKAGQSQPASGAAFGSESVYDTNYKAVLSLNDSAATTTDNYKDRTSNGNHGTFKATSPSTPTPWRDPGQIGKAADFDSANLEYLELKNITACNNATELTLSAWVHVEDLTKDGVILSKGDFSANQCFLLWRDDVGSSSGRTDTFTITVGNGTSEKRIEGSTNKSNDTTSFHFVAATFKANDPAGLNLYVDGALDPVGPVSTVGFLATDSNTKPVIVGSTSTTGNFEGDIDEPRVSTVARSAAWIKLEYETQKTTVTALTTFDPETPGFPSGWKWKAKLTINKTYVDANLTDFPLLLRASSLPLDMLDADGPMRSQSDGGDIRFSADVRGDTRLPIEIVSYAQNATPASATAEIWVKVPTVKTASDTEIYVWWGHDDVQTASPDNGDYGKNQTWTNSFNGVWHLEGSFLDSTSNHNDGANNGSTALSSALIGAGRDFDGSSQYISVADAATVRPPNITVSAWYNARTWTTNFQSVLSKQQSISPYPSFDIRKKFGASNIQAAITVGGVHYEQDGGAVTINTWYHVAMTYDGEDLRMYHNGALAGTNAAPYGSIDTSAPAFTIGRHPTIPGRFFDGKIDEVRLCATARTNAWVRAEYESQKAGSTMVTSGAAGRAFPINAVKKRQSGAVSIPAGSSSVQVTINAVNLTKAVLLHSSRTLSVEPRQMCVKGWLINTTTIELSVQVSGVQVDIEWQVIEFTADSGVTVQRGIFSMAGVTTLDAALTPPVDLKRSFPIVSWRNDGSNYGSDDCLRAEITASDNLQLRSVDLGVDAGAWQVVQYDQCKVQHFLINGADSTTITQSIAAVNPDKTLIIGSGKSVGTVLNANNAYRISLDTVNTIKIEKFTTGQAVYLCVYVVEFLDHTKVQSILHSWGTSESTLDQTLNWEATPQSCVVLEGAQIFNYSPANIADDDGGESMFTLAFLSTTQVRVKRAKATVAAKTNLQLVQFVPEFMFKSWQS